MHFNFNKWTKNSPFKTFFWQSRTGLALVVCLLSGEFCHAQYGMAELDLDKDVSTWFDEQIGKDQTPLVAGIYQETYLSTNSHPLFLEKYWISGTLKYRGETFQDVSMLYNIHQDFLVIRHPTQLLLSNQPIRLEKNLVDWFILNSYYFKNFRDLNTESGFYNVLFEGTQFQLISKRSKKETIERNNNTLNFEKDDAFFLYKENGLHLIKNKSGFIKTYPELKKEIKSFVKKNSLNINPNNEQSLTTLAKFCDSKLNNQ